MKIFNLFILLNVVSNIFNYSGGFLLGCNKHIIKSRSILSMQPNNEWGLSGKYINKNYKIYRKNRELQIIINQTTYRSDNSFDQIIDNQNKLFNLIDQFNINQNKFQNTLMILMSK